MSGIQVFRGCSSIEVNESNRALLYTCKVLTSPSLSGLCIQL